MGEYKQIEIPKSFFLKERRQLYYYWREAFWRELIQNSVDAGATKITITVEELPNKKTRIAFKDDGCGMTRETLHDVYFKLGESSKNDATSVGGFGRARILTCFAMDSYEIRSCDYVAKGHGALYSVEDSPKPIKGCEVHTWYADADGSVLQMTEAFNTYIEQCDLECAVYFNGARVARNKPGRREVRKLSLNGKEFAVLNVWSGRDDARVIRVLVKGVCMFQVHHESNHVGTLAIELDVEQSRDVLSANRDALRYPYSAELSKISNEMKVQSTTFRDRSTDTETTLHTGHTRYATKMGARVDSSSLYGYFVATNFNTADLETAFADKDEFIRWAGSVSVDIPQIRVSFLGNAAEKFAFEQHLGPNKIEFTIKPFDDKVTWTDGQESLFYARVWRKCVEEVFNVAMLTRSGQIKWDIGWCTGKIEALHAYAADTHYILLNPMNRDGFWISTLSDSVLKRMIALARHEVAHTWHADHDEAYAGCLTNIDATCMDWEILANLRAYINDQSAELGVDPASALNVTDPSAGGPTCGTV